MIDFMNTFENISEDNYSKQKSYKKISQERKMINDKIKFYDKEEKELYEALENDELISDFNKDIKEKYEEYAKNSLNKQKRINIRMTDRDFRKIQVKAIQEGIPYQSLISMLIHKFNEGKLKIL